MTRHRLLHRLAVTLALLLPCVASWAEQGVSAKDIRVGMVNAQSGPAAGLGQGMQAGVAAYFARINAAGGVHGRRLSLVIKDDSYEPSLSALHTQNLIEQERVFTLLGYVGTPTSRAALTIALRAQVPYLFPFTGADFLRHPPKPWVFNLRASYLEETEALVERMTQDLKVETIALLMQDDSFGESVKSGLNGALAKRGRQIQAEARILRNSLDIGAAVQTLQRDPPDAIVFVGTYRQLAMAIKQARAAGLQARFVTVSFIGTEDFIAAAGADGDGVYISQVVPPPRDSSLPLVRDYLQDIKPADIGYTSLEGYIGAGIFVQALRQAGANPTRASLVAALEKLHTDLGGFKVAFSPSNHQGSTAVFLTRVQNGQAVPTQHMY